MDTGSLWYLIERDKLHRVVTAQEFEQLKPDSFTLHQVFDNRREALHEMIRLVQAAVEEVSHQMDETTSGRTHPK